MGTAVLNIGVPFCLTEQYGQSAPDVRASARVRLISADARLLNPRKVLVRAELCADTDIFESCELISCAPPEDGEAAGLRFKTAELSAELVSSVTEKEVTVSDELMLPPGKPAPERLLSSESEIRVTETQITGGKLIVRGAIKTGVFYLPQDGAPEYFAFETQFSQLMEMPDCDCAEAEAMLTDAYTQLLSSASGGKSLELEVRAVLQAVGRRTEKIGYIADAYARAGDAECEYGGMAVERPMETRALEVSARSQFELQQPCSAVIGTFCRCGDAAIRDGMLSVPLNVSVIYQGSGGELLGETFAVTAQAEYGDGQTQANVSAAEAIAVPAGSGIEIRAQAGVCLRGFTEDSVSCLQSISLREDSEAPRRPSVTVVRAETDDLWGIAKKYRSDVGEIIKYNCLDSDTCLPDKILLIP
jgi:hypothetical protein